MNKLSNKIRWQPKIFLFFEGSILRKRIDDIRKRKTVYIFLVILFPYLESGKIEYLITNIRRDKRIT
jgi:hypothetical protein